jgi:hypothetical protein
LTALPTLFDTLSSLFQTDKVRNALPQRGRRTGTSATLDGALPLPQEALDLLCVYAACEDTPPVLGSYAHALVISTQNSKQRTKKVANHLVKKALAFSVPLEIDGEKNSKALATTDALTEKAASKVSAPSSKAVASAALSAATASATNSNSVEPGDSAVTPWVVGQGMEDATLQTLLSGGVVEARLLTELKTNNHFSSEEMCVRVLGCLFVDHCSERPMNQRDVAMRQVGKEPNVLFMESGKKIELFTLAYAFEGDPDRTQYVASLYNSDQQSSAVEENIEYELFVDVMEQIISMCVAATINSTEQGNRLKARALVKNNQLLMAHLGDCREIASEGGPNVAANKFMVEHYARLGCDASKHVYINPDTLAMEGTALAMAPSLRGARALLPTEVPKAAISDIMAKEGVDGTRNVEEQNGFYVDRATSSANLNVTNMSCVATQKLVAAAMRDSKEEVVRKIKTWIETVYVIVFDIKDGVRWRLESLVMQHFLLIVTEISHQPSVNAQLLCRVVEQALHIVSFVSAFVDTTNFC